jgi:hypothetical protein
MHITVLHLGGQRYVVPEHLSHHGLPEKSLRAKRTTFVRKFSFEGRGSTGQECSISPRKHGRPLRDSHHPSPTDPVDGRLGPSCWQRASEHSEVARVTREAVSRDLLRKLIQPDSHPPRRLAPLLKLASRRFNRFSAVSR